MRTRALAACAGLGLAACVSQGTYEREVEQRRALEARTQEQAARIAELERRIRGLEATGSSLHDERVKLLDELEDLREQAEQVRGELDREREQRTHEVRQVSDTYHSLVEELESEVASGRLEIERLQEGLQVRAGEAILFDSGSVEVKPAGLEVLRRVAGELRALADHEIRVEGHTDDRPIQTARFPSNWELSAARASAVARALVADGVSPALIAATGYGAERPIAPNQEPDGRARNRRIEILLIPQPK